MNVQKVISNMKKELPEIRDSIVKTVPVYRVLRDRSAFPHVINLALALGEDRLKADLPKLSLENDFVCDANNNYKLREFTSIHESEFYKSVYMRIVGQQVMMHDIITCGGVDVHVVEDFDVVKQRTYKEPYSIPKIAFIIPTRTILIYRGQMRIYRPEGYEHLDLPY